MRRALVAAVVAVAGCASAGSSSERARIEALADAERAFAASAEASGVKAAFVGALADDATLFRPGPVAGRAFIAGRPERPYRLAWKPQRVAVAASDELGYSSGPSRLVLDARPDDPQYGHFFTVWRRGDDGRWRVLVDHGAANPGPAGWDAPFDALAADGSTAARSVDAAEGDFARASERDGVAAAYRAFGSSRLRLLRDGVAPTDGISAAAAMPDAAARWSWTVTERGTARSADLAWTMGRYRAPGDGKGATAGSSSGWYVRVWRAERGDWKIVGDVLAPLDD